MNSFTAFIGQITITTAILYYGYVAVWAISSQEMPEISLWGFIIISAVLCATFNFNTSKDRKKRLANKIVSTGLEVRKKYKKMCPNEIRTPEEEFVSGLLLASLSVDKEVGLYVDELL